MNPTKLVVLSAQHKVSLVQEKNPVTSGSWQVSGGYPPAPSFLEHRASLHSISTILNYYLLELSYLQA
jgi:hypothetical protein